MCCGTCALPLILMITFFFFKMYLNLFRSVLETPGEINAKDWEDGRCLLGKSEDLSLVLGTQGKSQLWWHTCSPSAGQVNTGMDPISLDSHPSIKKPTNPRPQ